MFKLYCPQEFLDNNLKNVELWSMLYTDNWAGYNNRNNIGHSYYTRNHKTNFVGPITSVHAQIPKSIGLLQSGG